MEYLLLELHCFHGCLSLVKSESQTIYIRHVEENEEGLINNLDSFWKIVWKSKRSMQCAALTSFFFLRRLVLTTGLFSFAMIELMMMMMINSRLIVMIILMNMIIMMMMTLIMMMMMSWRSYSLNVFKILTWTSPFSYLSLKYPFETFLVVAGFLYERKKSGILYSTTTTTTTTAK